MEIPIQLNMPDQERVDPLGQIIINGIVTDSGVKLRPGSSSFFDVNTGADVDLIFDWDEHGIVIVVSGGKIFSQTELNIDFFTAIENEDSSGTIILEDGENLWLEPDVVTTEVTDDTMIAGNPVTVANFGDYIFLASGGRIGELHHETAVVAHSGTTYTAIQNSIAIEPGVTSGWASYWSAAGSGGSAWSEYIRYGSGKVEFIADADAPTKVSWIDVEDTYLLALEDSSARMWFSDVGDPWSWDSEWVSAGSKPDDATCMKVLDGQVIIGGRRSIQTFIDDGVTPWVASSYGALSIGVLAPRTFIPVNGNFIFIDTSRRLVTLTGRIAQTINHTLDTFINTLSQIDDADANYIVLGGTQFYILRFPTEGKTVALNIDAGSWTHWETDGGVWDATAMAYIQGWDITLIGTSAGLVNMISRIYSTDDGTEITAKIRTPRMQTAARMMISRLMIALTRVEDDEADASFTVRWRDDGGDWSAVRTITVSNATDNIENLYRVGSYRENRQYEIGISNLYPYALQRVEQL